MVSNVSSSIFDSTLTVQKRKIVASGLLGKYVIFMRKHTPNNISDLYLNLSKNL